MDTYRVRLAIRNEGEIKSLGTCIPIILRQSAKIRVILALKALENMNIILISRHNVLCTLKRVNKIYVQRHQMLQNKILSNAVTYVCLFLSNNS